MLRRSFSFLPKNKNSKLNQNKLTQTETTALIAFKIP